MLNQITGSLELAKFSTLEDERIRSFVASIPRTLLDAVDLVRAQSKPVDGSTLTNRMALAGVASKFHSDAYTQTDAVAESISALSDPETVVLVSTHQPNLFAYGGVFKKIVLLESLAGAVRAASENKKVVNLFLIVDHDFMDETWVRLAQLPSIDHAGGICELRLRIKESQRWLMVSNAPIPDRFIIARWKSEIKSWIRGNAESKEERDNCMQRFTEMWQEFERAYGAARSYSDLNSFFMSRIVNGGWGYGTVFVRLSDLSAVFSRGYRWLLENHTTYSRALKDAEQKMMRNGIDTGVSGSSHLFAPVWAHCSCGGKASAKIERHASSSLLSGTCLRCFKEIVLDATSAETLRDTISPRAIPIPILLSRELGVACYASGTGGLGYMVDYSVVSDALGVHIPTVALWFSRDKYHGIGQRKALTASSGEIENVCSTEESDREQHRALEKQIRSFLAERKARSLKAEPDANFLSQLLALKERQREIRARVSLAEKVRGATNVSPCFIDYAVNFGIKGAERFWAHHLLARGHLMEDIRPVPAVA